MKGVETTLDGTTLVVRIPMRLQRRGGRKLIMTPEGAAMPTPKPRPDETLIKALVRAHRWLRGFESGQAMLGAGHRGCDPGRAAADGTQVG